MWAGGRLAHMGGGMPRDPWPVQDFKEICGVRNDKGGPLPPRNAFQQVPHILCWSMRYGCVLMVITQEGVNVCLCPPSPSSDRSSPAQNTGDKTGWVHGHAPLAMRVHAPPPALSWIY
jgi:hypothetical protein